MLSRLIVSVLCLHHVGAYMFYQQEIPNGDKVPYSCKVGQIWPGVGHHNSQGTGSRNPFGLDFAKAGKKWTPELCKLDSDGDGQSNGQELGDPNCVWTKGMTPSGPATSHPGICDSWESPKCMDKVMTDSNYATQKEWLAEACKSDAFVCPAINETGIKQMILRIPKGTPVPAKETTYECQIFNLTALGLPSTESSHLVAATPIIDNKDILHHMVLSACKDTTLPTSEPYECGMVAHLDCQEYIHVWTVGLLGECYHPDSGIRIGLNGVKIVAIQLHWNNPTAESGKTDSSGLLLHYTPKLRPYDAGVMMIGNTMFYLPPKRDKIVITSKCSESCTKSIVKGHIQVTSVWNHMHYAGKAMSIAVVRNGQHLKYLTNDKFYSYDSPQVYQYPNPFQLEAGDAIVSNCIFNTVNRVKTTFFGEATNDEMCLGFLTYYPRQNTTTAFCVDEMGISYCNLASYEGCTKLRDFLDNVNTTQAYRQVVQMCRQYAPCLDECRDTIIAFMKTEKCMQGNIWDYIQEKYSERNSEHGKIFLSYLASCKLEVYAAMYSSPPEQPTTVQPTTVQPTTGKLQVVVTTDKPQPGTNDKDTTKPNDVKQPQSDLHCNNLATSATIGSFFVVLVTIATASLFWTE